MSKILYNTKYLQLKSTSTKGGGEWVYAHRPNAKDVVIILPYTDSEVLFLIEERPPIIAEYDKHFSIALPAGLVGDERIGETIEDAIHAELLEETGLKSDKIEIVTKKSASSAGCLSEICTIALAYIQNKTPVQEPLSDDGIILKRHWVKKDEVKKWLKQKEQEGYFLTAQTLAALFYLY